MGHTPNEIEVECPPNSSKDPTCEPGEFLLTVSMGNELSQKDGYDLTIGGIIACPPGKYLTGIRDGQPVCAFACVPREFVDATTDIKGDLRVCGGEKPDNYPPKAFDQKKITEQDTPVAITLKATDEDGDRLTYTITSDPKNGTALPRSGEIPPGVTTYTPDTGFSGPDSFTFYVDDGTGESNSRSPDATVYIKVIPCNPVRWTDLVGVEVESDNNTFLRNSKTPRGWGTGGAASKNEIMGDGSFKFNAAAGNFGPVVAGLSTDNKDAGYLSIEYGIDLDVRTEYKQDI